jgi:LDH2 family malate/lactate/ureidoglycolate dehydrogenase
LIGRLPAEGEQGTMEADSKAASEGRMVYVSPDAAKSFARGLLMANGMPDADAGIVAACLVRADLRGVDTHGLMRLPGYLDRLRRGLINANPKLEPKRVTPVAASLDGQDGFGFVVATRAMAEAIAIAETYGVGVVAVRRSTHFGMAAQYVLQAIEAGYMSLVFTNASPSMPPWGGREAMLGTSPFAAGAPGGREGPFVLDMSPAVAARGKIRRAERRGETIPEGYALDAEGRPTTDPSKALQGVVLPIGGPKGSGIAMLMDIFGGVISGAGFAGGVADQYKRFDMAQDVGHFFLAMKPDLFISADKYRARMDILVQRVHGSPRAEGFSEVLMPGEIEARQEAQRRREGLAFSRGEVATLQEEAAKAGVAPLEVNEQPLAA